MKAEIEAKFLAVQVDTMRSKLNKVGATCKQPMMLMRRVVFDNDVMNEKNAYLRVRDEGHRITMTYKQFDEISLTGAKEIEFNVSDYEAAIDLIKAIGIKVGCIQEARRELWQLGDAEVVIDEWPWIKPFIEIEGPTEQSVKEAAAKLGFAWQDAAFGDIMTPYLAEYPHIDPGKMIYDLPTIRFEDPRPEMLKV